MDFKKPLKVLATGILAVSLLAACGSNSKTTGNHVSKGTKDTSKAKSTQVAQVKPEDGAKLTVWYSGPGDKDWATKIASQFTSKYNVPVKLENVGSADAPGKMAKDGPAGLGADVFTAPHDHTGDMVAQGIVYKNMDPSYYKKNDISAAINGVSTNDSNGKYTMYGYPLEIQTYGLFYNKTLLKKEGMTLPTTWDELFADAKKFNNDSSISGKHYGFMMDVGNEYYMQSFLSAYGGYVFGKNNTDPSDLGLSGDPAAKTVAFLNKMHAILPIKQASITGDAMTSLFDQSKLLFYVDGPWAVAGHKKAADKAGFEFGVTPLPQLDNGKYPQSFSTVNALFVNANTKYPKAAYLYAKFATSPDAQKLRYQIEQTLPVAKSLADSSTIQANPINAAFLKQGTRAIPMPNIPQMQAVWGPMGTAFVTAWDKPNGTAPFDKAEAAIKTALSSQTK